MFDSRAFPTSWLQSRYDLIVGLGALCVLLQQITVDYQSQLSGLTIKGSLIHLHMALLFAVAMLARTDPNEQASVVLCPELEDIHP